MYYGVTGSYFFKSAIWRGVEPPPKSSYRVPDIHYPNNLFPMRVFVDILWRIGCWRPTILIAAWATMGN